MHFPTAVVMYPALTWYADHELRHAPTPAGLLDPARWAEIVVTYAKRWNGQRDGVVLLRAGGSLTVRERVAVTAVFLNQLEAQGWKSNPIGAETGWFTCRQPLHDGSTVMFGVLPWMDQARTSLFQLDAGADEMAFRLAEYQRLTGSVWRGTGGLSGTGLLRAMYPAQRQPRWRWDRIPSEVHGRSFELLGSHHHRAPVDEGPFVHIYDTRAMYLAGALVAELAWDVPEWRGPQEFDPARPGYWRVSIPDLHVACEKVTGERSYWPDGGVRWLSRLVRAQDNTPLVWVTTPVMRYLVERLGPIEIHDSLTADQSSRVMRGWAERLRDARAGADTDLIPAIKDTYSRTVGMLRRNGGRVYRPDWRDTIVDTAKVNLIRKVDRAGKGPLRWNVDAVWITSDQEIAPNLFGDTGNIGGLHDVGTMTLDDYHTRYQRELVK